MISENPIFTKIQVARIELKMKTYYNYDLKDTTLFIKNFWLPIVDDFDFI